MPVRSPSVFSLRLVAQSIQRCPMRRFGSVPAHSNKARHFLFRIRICTLQISKFIDAFNAIITVLKRSLFPILLHKNSVPCPMTPSIGSQTSQLLGTLSEVLFLFRGSVHLLGHDPATSPKRLVEYFGDCVEDQRSAVTATYRNSGQRAAFLEDLSTKIFMIPRGIKLFGDTQFSGSES